MKVNLQSFRRMFAASMMAVVAFATAGASDIHVATTGSDSNAGTEEAPLATIHKAMEMVQAGDRILVHEGTYYITERIKVPELQTTADLRCELRAYPEDAAGKVIIDGSQMKPASEIAFKQSRCIYVNHLANYWTFYGLVLQNAKDNGMKVEGSYNVIERCVFRWNNDTGLQLGMFKDFSIEETKSFPISGQPQFNPGYTYCRYNKVINCDSYENYDKESFSGSDDGGDADGFACKLFPGPGTEFHGCRAWTNSDDNWDLYMVYHPVVIDRCWAWHAGYTPDGQEGKNGNGFKLGGGGSAGGAAFDQSTGAHVVTNCVAFGNLHKGFDQNNAYEGMYIINCTAWGNEYNYRFPTIFKYGGMVIRNCIGWGASAEKSGYPVGNREFLSPDKEGYQEPNTAFNSWIDIDGCHPVKECYKDGKNYTPATQNHSGEFLSLSVSDFMAAREADGSLPNNGFARLKEGSIFKDKGTPIIGFEPKRFMTIEEATAAGLELIQADDLYLGYNDDAPDFGAFELDGTPASFPIPEKIVLKCTTANSLQEIKRGQPIEEITYEWTAVGTDAAVENLAEGLSYKVEGNSLTISGTPQDDCTYKITVSGDASEGVKPVTTTGIIALVTPFKVLTDGWYHFQDPQDQLPADLKDIFSLLQGDNTSTTTDGQHLKGDTYIDPTKEEENSGYDKGAVCMGESNGGFTIKLDKGVLKLLLNLYFTGGRAFKITCTMEDGTQKTATTEKYKKGAYSDYDVLTEAGLTDEADCMKVRSITFQQNGANGGTRIYDMYVRIPDVTETGITAVSSSSNAAVTFKYIDNNRIVISKGGNTYNTQGQRVF